GGELEWPPGVEALRQLQLGGEDSDHLERVAADLHGLADDVRVAREPPLPERLSEDDDAAVAGHLLVAAEPPSMRRLHAEHRQQRRAGPSEPDVLGRIGPGEAAAAPRPGGDAAGRLEALVVEAELGAGDGAVAEPARPVEAHQLLRLVERQR